MTGLGAFVARFTPRLHRRQRYRQATAILRDRRQRSVGRARSRFQARLPGLRRLAALLCQQPQRRYPVLYVTDADYAFPIIRQLGRRLNVEGPKIEEFILVGLSYAKGEEGRVSRQRDYTPTPNGPSTAPANSIHGQAQAYQQYLRDQVKPFITTRYRADPAKAIFLGHSTAHCWARRSFSPSLTCSAATSLAARRSGTTSDTP